ncbi:hypothetical protein M673_10485 [Aureimonas sp. AU20]|nr:hypothetical protein M673_10485 [Aureimonas sp. AU20]
MQASPLVRFAAVIALAALAGCQSSGGPVTVARASEFGAPNGAEARYARDTGRAIYRGRPFQRTQGFVFADPARGFALCLRAPMRDGRQDHTLLILQRRIEGAVSQVEDDVQIVRAAADVGLCRNRSDWVDAR